jgi:hypothetical protein
MQTYIIKEVRPATDSADMTAFREYLKGGSVGPQPDDVKKRLEIRHIRGRRKLAEWRMRCHI